MRTTEGEVVTDQERRRKIGVCMNTVNEFATYVRRSIDRSSEAFCVHPTVLANFDTKSLARVAFRYAAEASRLAEEAGWEL